MSIALDDESTWPPHEDDGTGRISPFTDVYGQNADGTCVPDCVRCQLIVLREEQGFDDAPYNYQTGAFNNDEGFAMSERVRELEGLVAKTIVGAIKPDDLSLRTPTCDRTGRCTINDDGVCIFCGDPRPPGGTP